VTRSQFYDRKLQRRGQPSTFWKQKYFFSILKNAVAYYNTGFKFKRCRIGSRFANCRLLGEYFLWAHFFISVVDNIFRTLFPQKRLCVNFDNKNSILARLFHKLIWPHWLQPWVGTERNWFYSIKAI
jgi:hypothetical protein